MIIQLGNGRIIEMSLEQYLELSEQDLKDIEGLSKQYTKDPLNPFYNSFAKKDNTEKPKKDKDKEDHRKDPYFNPED